MKAKADFEKWRLKLHQRWVEEKDEESLYYGYSTFLELPDSMKWGVLVDFYDSVGIYINIIYECSEEDCYYYFDGVFMDKYDIGENMYKTRTEARKQALIKAEQIYNEL